MKNAKYIAICLLLAANLTACGNADNDTVKPEETSVPTQSTDTQPTKAKSADGIDVDLTQLSSTMVYSEVYNMMVTPENYVGKNVKMDGQFGLYCGTNPDGTPNEDQLYYACIIADATGCCSQGLEFVLAGDRTYPDDYPERGDYISVVGTFDLYEENGSKYCRLIDARLV